mgnify:CR=1 FL=1
MTSQNHAGAGAPIPDAPASAVVAADQANPAFAAATSAATTASTATAAATNIPAQASPSPAASTTAAGHTEAPLAQASPTQAEHPTQAPLTQAPLTQAPLTQPSTTQAGRRRRRVVHLGPKDRERVAEGANLDQVVHEALGNVDAERPAWSREDLRREDPSAHANDARLLDDVPPHYGNGV